MALSCRGCGNDKAYRVSVRLIGGTYTDICNRCGSVGSTYVPDVYWPGQAYKSENITDKNGNPILLTSRRHKAEVMREQGIVEAGDRYHGSRMESLNHMAAQKPTNSREQIRAAMQTAALQLKRKYNR